MTGFLKTFLLALLVAATVGVSSPGFALQNTDLSAVQRQHDTVARERVALLEQLQGLESQYHGLVSKIEKLKSDGAIRTIGGRIELQNLLTKSKAIADELDGLQSKVRALDNKLAGQRSTLVAGIDGRLSQLERSLSSARPSSRPAIVAELNQLRQRRSAYTTPLPAAPSAVDVNSALQLAEAAAHPDELMAAADELQDTEDQLRKRLAGIESKLAELREARALARRARTFSRAEKFFEETDRDRVIARYERVTVAQSPSTPSSTAGGSQTDATGDQAANAPPSFAAPEPGGNTAANEDGLGASFDGEATADSRGSEPALVDSPSGAPVAAGGDVFETSRQTIVIDGGMDPSRAVGAIGGSNSKVEGQIKQLETEQQNLARQADALRKRAQDLRKRAEQM